MNISFIDDTYCCTCSSCENEVICSLLRQSGIHWYQVTFAIVVGIFLQPVRNESLHKVFICKLFHRLTTLQLVSVLVQLRRNDDPSSEFKRSIRVPNNVVKFAPIFWSNQLLSSSFINENIKKLVTSIAKFKFRLSNYRTSLSMLYIWLDLRV